MNINITKDNKILIVTPHQDDESIGCGGLLSKYGKQCDVLLLTDGAYSFDGLTKDKMVIIRNKEFDKAMKYVKVNKTYKFNLPCEEMKKHKREIERFDITPYDYVFVPNNKEAHSDHCVCLSIFKEMKFKQKSKAKILMYEVWTPLRYPTWILDVSDVMDKKTKLLQHYQSQILERDYVHYSTGLSMYRGMAIKNKYGEAYSDPLYNDISSFFYNLVPKKIKTIIANLFA